MTKITDTDSRLPVLSFQNKYSLKVGLFGIGLDTYWPQFEGLYDRLVGYLHIVEQGIQQPIHDRPTLT